jgi:hypothetical protein
MYESGRIRVSDADRESIVVKLTAATAEGRLTLAEFEDRSSRAYASRTWEDLVVLLEDLPGQQMVRPFPPPGYSGSLEERRNNGLAIAALIVGVVSILGVSCPPAAPVAGAAAIGLGVFGLRAERDHPEIGGHGLAWAGIATGAGGMLLGGLAILLLFVLGT